MSGGGYIYCSRAICIYLLVEVRCKKVVAAVVVSHIQRSILVSFQLEVQSRVICTLDIYIYTVDGDRFKLCCLLLCRESY